MKHRTGSLVSLLGCAALAAALAGCGQGPAAQPVAKGVRASPAGDARDAGKLAAKVNGTPISVVQLSGVGGAAGGAAGASSAQALEKIIDRELLVQKALQAKLDRDPQVVQAIETSRRQLLAQAYLERAAAAAKSTPDEVSAFYSENPALFAQRRIYRLRELVVTASADQLELIRSEAASATDLDEVAGWLKWRNLKVGPVTGATQPAEQLPLGHLSRLAGMRQGEIAVFASAPGATLVQLVHAQDAPLTEQQAAPLIEQFIAGRKRLELAAAEVRRLREVATIEYVGDFKR
jgi:EpsD family peptidyl-prolyl cis-trans isomerase